MSAPGLHRRRTGLGQRQDHADAGHAARRCAGAAWRSARSRSAPTISTRPSTPPPPAAPTYNIDPWAMRFETLAGLLEESGQGCDLLLGEGVMGLFDGAADGTGATADVAALFGLPVLLVVDVTGMGASVAALIDGFRRHREDVEVVGVILNRVASAAHGEMLSRACFEHVSTPVLGMIPRDAALALPSRHLGLVQAAEHPDLAAFIAAAGELVEAAGRARPAAAAGAPAQRVDPRPRHAALAAARPAHRRGARPRLRLRLQRRAGRLAAAGRRAQPVLAAGRRGAGPDGRRGLSARRLSRAARRPAGRQRAVPRRPARRPRRAAPSSMASAAAT